MTSEKSAPADLVEVVKAALLEPIRFLGGPGLQERAQALRVISAYQAHMASDGVVQADIDIATAIVSGAKGFGVKLGPRHSAIALVAAHRRAAAGGKGDGPSAAEAWQELVEKDDRTSPSEYPDMALITRDELAELMEFAHPRDAEIAKLEKIIQHESALTNERDTWLAEARAEITDLQAKLAEAQADAGRYRWLRDNSCPPHNFYVSVPDEFHDVRYSPQEVDAYIDEALAALNRSN